MRLKTAPVGNKAGDISCLFERKRDRRAVSGDAVAPGVTFSIVISTDGRRAHLERALSALRYQTYANFEVCVVAGPTEDGTRAFVREQDKQLKVRLCEERNLSKSRNLGIAAAAGQVVAFIDDDAVPEPEWLSQLARSYDDERVGAVGGVVHDSDGVDYQARFVTVDRMGKPKEEPRPTPELNVPGAARFPHLLGTNCSFRRSALVEVGGFDEEYEYFLDETDLCCRINDAGYRIVQRPDAFVHHKYAASSLRDEQGAVRQWYPLIKNRLYFGMRHARDKFSVVEIVEAALAERDFWAADVKEKVQSGLLDPADGERFQSEASAALEDGLRSAMRPRKLLTAKASKSADSRATGFLPYPRLVPKEGRRTLAYLLRDSSATEGLLRHAHSAAAAGNLAFLVRPGHGGPTVDYADGVWIHELGWASDPTVSADDPRLQASISRIDARHGIDAIYCKKIDYEALQGIGHPLRGPETTFGEEQS